VINSKLKSEEKKMQDVAKRVGGGGRDKRNFNNEKLVNMSFNSTSSFIL